MRYLLSAIIILTSLSNIFAQRIESIITDRPDQTESAFNVPKGFVQIEMGAVYEREKIDNETKMEYYSHPALLIRYGLLKTLELRLGTELVNEKFTKGGNNSHARGFRPMFLGTKIKICSEKGIRPQTALIMHITLPKLGHAHFHNQYTAPDFRFTMQNSLSEMFTLSYNVGAEWDGISPNAAGLYTVSFGMSLADMLGLFVESYGFLKEKESPDHRIDGGLTYLIQPNLQLDASGGLGITNISPDYFIGFGVSLRLPL